MSFGSEICNRLYELADTENGRNVSIEVNGVPLHVIQRLEDADHVLRLNNNNYRKNLAWLRQTIGKSRFTEDGKAWEIRRDLTQPFYAKFDRQRLFEISVRHARNVLAKMIERSASGNPTLDDKMMRDLTARVLLEYYFNVTLEDTRMDIQALADLLEYGSEYSSTPVGSVGSLTRERLAQLPELHGKVLETLSYLRSPDMPRSELLDRLLAVDADPTNDIVLEHELMIFMATGTEVSGVSTGWLCHTLATHPELQKELRKLAIDFWQGDDPSWEKLTAIKPLSAFISETLRLYPGAPIASRLANEADVIGDHKVNPDDIILISLIGIQHDRRFREDPWKLDIGESARQPASGEGTAFSIGPRVCGGKMFALVEILCFLSVFLAEAEFTTTSDEPIDFYWKSQMVRKGGHRVKVTPFRQ